MVFLLGWMDSCDPWLPGQAYLGLAGPACLPLSSVSLGGHQCCCSLAWAMSLWSLPMVQLEFWQLMFWMRLYSQGESKAAIMWPKLLQVTWLWSKDIIFRIGKLHTQTAWGAICSESKARSEHWSGLISHTVHYIDNHPSSVLNHLWCSQGFRLFGGFNYPLGKKPFSLWGCFLLSPHPQPFLQ